MSNSGWWAHDQNYAIGWLVALPLANLVCEKTGRKRETEDRGRAMSFGSAFMYIGSWPTDAGMAAPIITACL